MHFWSAFNQVLLFFPIQYNIVKMIKTLLAGQLYENVMEGYQSWCRRRIGKRKSEIERLQKTCMSTFFLKKKNSNASLERIQEATLYPYLLKSLLILLLLSYSANYLWIRCEDYVDVRYHVQLYNNVQHVKDKYFKLINWDWCKVP